MADRRRLLGSVRARITLAATLVVLGVLVAAAVLLVVSQRRGLVEQLDEGLEIDADRIATALERRTSITDLGDDDGDRIVFVVQPDGAVRPLSSDVEMADVVGLGALDEGTATIGGDRFRVVVETYDVGEEEGRVVVAGALDDVDETVGELARTLALIVPAATLLLAAVVWLLVGRTLRPVERIRAEVDAIGLEQLDRRVPEPGGDDEIGRLAVTMNAMLDRLDRSNQRQQRFVADASHELRTPLTRMRTELEVDQRDPAHADPDRTRESTLEEIATLQRLIDDLLVLARGDGHAPAATAPVDLDDLVLEEAAAAGGVDVSSVSAAQVVGDASALRRVVRNLLDNAVRHASGRVKVTVGEAGPTAVVIVDDDGPGIAPEHRDEVFERFARLDDARTAGSGRTGLGLAIVRAVVTEHGGTVAISDSPLGGARISVSLPRG